MEIKDELLEKAVHGALSAGSAVMEEYGDITFTQKEDKSPVTKADARAHEVIMSILEATNLPILSEESDHTDFSYTSRFWIIDPVDGTRDFLAKTGDFAVMIALVEDGAPTRGVVYAPAQKKLYYAKKGYGAFLVHKDITHKLQVGNRATNLRCIRSMHHFGVRSSYIIRALDAEEIPHGSIGIKAGLIAEDAGDFSLSYGTLGEWDVAAPEIILTEAGGSVTDIDGNSLFYKNVDHRIQNGVAFSNGVCHKHLITLMQKFRDLKE